MGKVGIVHKSSPGGRSLATSCPWLGGFGGTIHILSYLFCLNINQILFVKVSEFNILLAMGQTFQHKIRKLHN